MTNQIKLGKTNTWGVDRQISLGRNGLRRHVYMIGKTGCGKSTLLFSMLSQQINQGHGVALIDPHGDLADKVIRSIPDTRIKDVCYFNPGDVEQPVSFNVLADVPEEDRPVYASGLVESFKAIWKDSWGPRLEYVLYNAISALLDCENVSLLSLQRMLVESDYRDWVVRQVKNPMMRAFWVNEFAGYEPRYAREIVSPILNKVGPFLTNPITRNIVGQVTQSINLREMMDQRKILIVNLSKGKMGETSSNLLGSLLVGMIQQAAWGRANQPEEDRVDFSLYIDEFQNFTTSSFASILAEARKYRLGLVMANQYVAQLHPEVLPAVFGNAGTILSFQIGHADADRISLEFDDHPPRYFPEIERFHTLARVYSDATYTAPCLLKLAKDDSLGSDETFEAVVDHSRRKYTKPRNIVEDKIKRWFGENEM